MHIKLFPNQRKHSTRPDDTALRVVASENVGTATFLQQVGADEASITHAAYLQVLAVQQWQLHEDRGWQAGTVNHAANGSISIIDSCMLALAISVSAVASRPKRFGSSLVEQRSAVCMQRVWQHSRDQRWQP